MHKNYNMKQITLSLNLEIYLEEKDNAHIIDELVENISKDLFLFLKTKCEFLLINQK